MQKNILYLRTDVYDKEIIAGGSVTHTIGIIEGFLQLQYNVVVATTCLMNHLKQLPLIHIEELRNPSWCNILRWKLNSLISNIFFIKKINQLINDYHPDYLYQRYSAYNISGVLAKIIKKIPLILEYNGSEVWVDQHWNKKNFFSLSWFLRWFEKINLDNADYIVVVSQALFDNLVAEGISKNKIIICPNGVNVDYFNPAIVDTQRATLRNQLSLQHNFVVGFSGTFSAWHGIDILAQIIIQTCKETSDVHFMLIGDGVLLTMLQKKITDAGFNYRVTYTGLISAEQVREYLSVCDAFVSPTQPNKDGSRFFGSPTKIFEYLSMAKPVIASDIEQLTEVIYPAYKIDHVEISIELHDQIGILVKPERNHEFVQAIKLLRNMSQEELEQIGSKARDRACQYFQWKQHVAKIMKLIHE